MFEYLLYRFVSRITMDREQIEVRRHRISGLDLCDITLDELDDIERSGSDVGLDFNVAIFSLGIGVSFFSSLLATTIASRKVFDTFVMLAIVGFSLAIIFFIKWFRNRGDFARRIQKVRDRQVGPFGDEEKNIKPSELANLTPVEPPPPTEPPATEPTR